MKDILMRAQEVKETKDIKEAALLLQSGDWLAVNAAIQGEDVVLVLIRAKFHNGCHGNLLSGDIADYHPSRP